MEKKREKEAIDLFIASVGKEPKACGYNAIDIYEKQRAYIYAKDEKTLKAFKSSQNIIRWIILWGFWPIFLCLCIIFFYGIPRVETIEDLQNNTAKFIKNLKDAAEFSNIDIQRQMSENERRDERRKAANPKGGKDK